MLVGTLDIWGMLQCGAYHCSESCQLDCWAQLPEVPLQEPHCPPVSSHCYILNVGGERRGHCWWWCPGTCWCLCFTVFAYGESSWMSWLFCACWAWRGWHCIRVGWIPCARHVPILPESRPSWSRVWSCRSLILLDRRLSSAKSKKSSTGVLTALCNS